MLPSVNDFAVALAGPENNQLTRPGLAARPRLWHHRWAQPSWHEGTNGDR